MNDKIVFLREIERHPESSEWQKSGERWRERRKSREDDEEEEEEIASAKI